MRDVRVRLVEMLTYPRVMAVDAIRENDCPYGHRFAAGEEKCSRCENGTECEWLESGEPFVDLATKPESALVQSLLVAIDFVDANNHRTGRSVGVCTCQSCKWLKDAQQLLREIDGRAVFSHN
ncbi:MAG: hypothetical protein ACWGPN_03765 [Gammaproteobacteria bacterium]